MSKTFTIRFEISMTPTELPGISDWSNGFTLEKNLSGDFIGTSEGLFINSGQAEGMRSYMVTEKLSGQTAGGEPSELILEHGGIENDESAWFGRIVPGTGTGAFADATGTIIFDADDQGEMMVLKLN